MTSGMLGLRGNDLDEKHTPEVMILDPEQLKTPVWRPYLKSEEVERQGCSGLPLASLLLSLAVHDVSHPQQGLSAWVAAWQLPSILGRPSRLNAAHAIEQMPWVVSLCKICMHGRTVLYDQLSLPESDGLCRQALVEARAMRLRAAAPLTARTDQAQRMEA